MSQPVNILSTFYCPSVQKCEILGSSLVNAHSTSSPCSASNNSIANVLHKKRNSLRLWWWVLHSRGQRAWQEAFRPTDQLCRRDLCITYTSMEGNDCDNWSLPHQHGVAALNMATGVVPVGKMLELCQYPWPFSSCLLTF